MHSLKVLRARRALANHRRTFRRIAAPITLALLGSLSASSVSAQSCGFVGERQVKSYWIEGSVGLVIVPTEAFANPTACLRSDQMFVLSNNPQYKNILASVMHSMATGTPIQAYACGCHTYWSNQSWPIAVSFGVGGAPR